MSQLTKDGYEKQKHQMPMWQMIVITIVSVVGFIGIVAFSYFLYKKSIKDDYEGFEEFEGLESIKGLRVTKASGSGCPQNSTLFDGHCYEHDNENHMEILKGLKHRQRMGL